MRFEQFVEERKNPTLTTHLQKRLRYRLFRISSLLTFAKLGPLCSIKMSWESQKDKDSKGLGEFLNNNNAQNTRLLSCSARLCSRGWVPPRALADGTSQGQVPCERVTFRAHRAKEHLDLGRSLSPCERTKSKFAVRTDHEQIPLITRKGRCCYA